MATENLSEFIAVNKPTRFLKSTKDNLLLEVPAKIVNMEVKVFLYK